MLYCIDCHRDVTLRIHGRCVECNKIHVNQGKYEMKTRAEYLGPQYGLKGEWKYALVNVKCDEGVTTVAYKPELHSLSSSDHLQMIRDKRKPQDSTEAIYSVLDAWQNLGRV